MPTFHAFIDESGQRSTSTASSDHFILSAVIIESEDLPAVAAAHAKLRTDLGRRPGDHLHWNNLRAHAQRLHAAQSLARMPLAVSSVVVCKRHITTPIADQDQAYLFTFRFLLERLSWFARDRSGVATITLAHVVRFPTYKLRQYEAALLTNRTEIEWRALDPAGGRIDQPTRVEQLQLADIAASATALAFEPDRYGNTERRYLEELSPALYRRKKGPITSYGLKMHPWNDATKAAYPWAAAL